MTKASWKKSNEETKFSREVVRLNQSIVNNTYKTEYGGLLNPNFYHVLKYAPASYYMMIEYDDGYGITVDAPNYHMWTIFSELSAQVYVHTDGRRFTRVFIYDDKHKVVGSVDIPEHRTE